LPAASGSFGGVGFVPALWSKLTFRQVAARRAAFYHGGMDIATAALIRKRAELAGEIEARAAELDQLRADLMHLDAAIRMMCPAAEPELIPPKKPSRKGCDWFGRQELPRLVLTSLRDAERPLSCVEIARTVMACKGLDPADSTALRRIEGMVKGALYRRQGRMVERVGNGRQVGWRITG
jgi:hypothetical protein